MWVQAAVPITLLAVVLRVMRVTLCAVLFRTGPLPGMRRAMIVTDSCAAVGMPAVLGSIPSQVSRLVLVGMGSPAIRLSAFKAMVVIVGLSKRWSRDDHGDNDVGKDTHQGDLHPAKHILDRPTGGFMAETRPESGSGLPQ